MNQLVRITMIAVLVSACGDSTGPKFGPLTAPTPAQQTAIAASSHNLSLIANATTDGQAAASAAINFALTAPSLLPDDSSARTLTEISGLAIEIEDLSAMVLLFTIDDCQVMTDHSVTWNHCVDGDTTVDGTMSWSAGHVDVDVHATAPSQPATPRPPAPRRAPGRRSPPRARAAGGPGGGAELRGGRGGAAAARPRRRGRGAPGTGWSR